MSTDDFYFPNKCRRCVLKKKNLFRSHKIIFNFVFKSVVKGYLILVTLTKMLALPTTTDVFNKLPKYISTYTYL